MGGLAVDGGGYPARAARMGHHELVGAGRDGHPPPILNGFEEFVVSFLNLFGQIDWVVSVPQFAQPLRAFFCKVRVLQETFARGQAWAVDLADFRTDAFLA